MFALWYGTITYQQYRDTIWRAFIKKQPKETAIISPSRIPVADTTTDRPGSPKLSQTNTPLAQSTPLTLRETVSTSLNNKVEILAPLRPTPMNETIESYDSFVPLAQSSPIKNRKPDPVKPQESEQDPERDLESPTLAPPPKPPRSPSPHPLRTEAFEEIEYEDEEVSSEGEDDENTVICSNQLNSGSTESR